MDAGCRNKSCYLSPLKSCVPIIYLVASCPSSEAYLESSQKMRTKLYRGCIISRTPTICLMCPCYTVFGIPAQTCLEPPTGRRTDLYSWNSSNMTQWDGRKRWHHCRLLHVTYIVCLPLTRCISKSTGQVHSRHILRTYFGRFSDGWDKKDEAGRLEARRETGRETGRERRSESRRKPHERTANLQTASQTCRADCTHANRQGGQDGQT